MRTVFLLLLYLLSATFRIYGVNQKERDLLSSIFRATTFSCSRVVVVMKVELKKYISDIPTI